MPIVWKKEMAVHNQIIDDEHKLLICLINGVEIALRAENHGMMVLFLVRELKTYTKDHFSAEEKIMLEHDYAGFSEHKRAHQDILQQIQELEESIRKAVDNEQALDAEELNLIGLLRSWIIDHVLQVDLKMRPLFD
ncbi:MAG: bacteriohemerythrin [Candidatus Thiodiazotropha taylori]|nr:bacteriohemerythrin [Candidatus Thiodiazotropha taylori]MCG7936599.1 bacteriohemerythrin [Candidatus Thiodiazotropha taylori]MCG8070054.1 bacteriohemerythrin [Candidatus Thiodiazotropha taylori]MCG8072522.1 bacteriohemerythrin [Candidatus Thiodiazotropha taylori]MCG8083828.1 bacteriohemerythrin [Candidatus Thiodiazotropha taylori]